MTKRVLKAEVRMGHKGPAIVWPFDPGREWPGRARHFVRGTMNGAPFEGEIGFRRRVFYTVVPDDLLAAAKVVPDAVVDVVVEAREPTPEEAAARPKLVGARLLARPAKKAKRRSTRRA